MPHANLLKLRRWLTEPPLSRYQAETQRQATEFGHARLCPYRAAGVAVGQEFPLAIDV